MREHEHWGIESEPVLSDSWSERKLFIEEQVKLGNLSQEEISDIPVFLSAEDIQFIIKYGKEWREAVQNSDEVRKKSIKSDTKNVYYFEFSEDGKSFFKKMIPPGERKIDGERIEAIQQLIKSNLGRFSKLSENEFMKLVFDQQTYMGIEKPIIADSSKIAYIVTTLMGGEIEGLSFLELGSGSNPRISNELRNGFGAKTTAIDLALMGDGGNGKTSNENEYDLEFLPYDVMQMSEYLVGRQYAACVSHAFFDTPIHYIAQERRISAQEVVQKIFDALDNLIMPGGLVVCSTEEIALEFNVASISKFKLIYPSKDQKEKIEGIYIFQHT